MLLQGYKSKWEWGIQISLIVIISSIVLNLMKLNSYSIIFYLLSMVLTYKYFKSPKFDLFSIASLGLFLLTVSGLLIKSNAAVEFKNIESKLLLLFLPILYAFDGLNKHKLIPSLFLTLSISVTAVSIFCLLNALVSYVDYRDVNVFFYHELLMPIKHHAIYFSIGVILSIIYLLVDKEILQKQLYLKICWISFLWIILFLLSSKMLILFAVVFVLSIQFKKISTTKIRAIVVGMVVLLIAVFSFKNPISQRFYEIANSKLSVITQETIGPDVYLNGLEFRLLQWRNTYDILNRHDAWITGVGFANSKNVLWEQYDLLKLYKGEDPTVLGGFYLYDLHNQYLQTTLQSGVIGLLVLLFFAFALLKKAFQSKNILLKALACMFMYLCFTENILDRQYGMVFFVFIPFFLKDIYYPKRHTKKESN